MLLPLEALEQYLSLKSKPEKIAEKLLLSGTKVEELKKVNGSTVFDLEITPNRPDTLSFFGLAREIAALFNLNLKEPETDLLVSLKELNKNPNFKVLDKKLCPSYSCVVLENITIKESPSYIQRTLKLAGIRPLNNVIDITNLVMLELGQPMHAFDADKIVGTAVLRGAKKGEKVVTLDGIERQMSEGSIIIADDKKLIDLAGLMGGQNSEIDIKTKRIMLLVPVYEPVTIRRTSLLTGLRTEASNRFEKKLDPNGHNLALRRAIKLLVEEAGATFASRIESKTSPIKETVVSFNLKKIDQILGIKLSLDEVINLLSPLGFLVNARPLEEGEISITVPSFRQDVSLPEDILEEIGRIHGYNNFPKTLPQGEIPEQKELFEVDKEKLTREYLVNNCFYETTGFSLVSEADLKKVGLKADGALKVLYPTSSDFVYLRPTLVINLLKAFSVNQGQSQLNFFEIGKEFKPEIEQKTKLPKQSQALALISDQSFGQVKAVIETLLTKFDLDLEQKALEKAELETFGTVFFHQGKQIAKVGLVNPEVLAKFEINSQPTMAWIDFEFLISQNLISNYQPLAKFPSVFEDISFFTPQKNSIEEIILFCKKFDNLINEAIVFDAFEKNDRLSLTLRLTFRSSSRTLTGDEVTKIKDKLEKELIKRFKVEIRKD